MDMDMYLENLEEFVLEENRIVTYITLSKFMGVHVNTAKQILYKFYMDNKEKGINAVYYVSGEVKSDADIADEKVNSTMCISLCSEPKLEGLKNKLSKILSIHIYCIGKTIPDETMNLKKMIDISTSEILGEENVKIKRPTGSFLIKGFKDILPKPSPEPSSSSNVSNNADQVIKNGKDSIQETKSKKDEKIAEKKPSFFKPIEKKPEEKKPFFKPVEKKPEEKKPFFKPAEKKPEEKKPETKIENKKTLSESPIPNKKKRDAIIDSDSDDDDFIKDTKSKMMKVTAEKKPPASTNKGKRKMPNKKNNTKSKPSAKPKIIHKVDSDSDEDSSEEDENLPESPIPNKKRRNVIESSDEEEEVMQVEEEQPVVKGKRREMKTRSETYLDDEGFMVTRQVSEVVSNSEESDVEEVKKDKKKEPTTPTKNNNEDKKNQSKSTTNGSNGSSKKSSSTSSSVKKEVQQPAQPKGKKNAKIDPKKQMAITSFFTRK